MKLLSSGGFALVQVMVAVAAAAGMGYYLMTQQQGANKLHSKSLGEEAMLSASTAIKTALSSSAICTHNFQNRTVGYSPTVLNNTSGQKIAEAGQEYPLLQGIKLISMRINQFKDPVSGEVADYLYVVYDLDPQNRKKLSGSKTIGRKFRLRGKKNIMQRYVFCYHEESNLVEQAAKQNCETMKGTWNNWDCQLDLNSIVNSSSVHCNVGKLGIEAGDGSLNTICNP